MNKISVVIIAKDEAVRIATTITSVIDFVDEVVVVDGGSVRCHHRNINS